MPASNNTEGLVYLLHWRSYTDSRIILDLMSREQGRFSGVYRYSRKSKKSLLPPYFHLLSAGWSGRSSLKNLHYLEVDDLSPVHLKGEALYCGFYLNEILVRLMANNDAAQSMFDFYQKTLFRLQQSKQRTVLEVTLREFEFFLFQMLGYGIDFTKDAHGSPLNSAASQYYCVVPRGGIMPLKSVSEGYASGFVISGEHLHGIAQSHWDDLDVRRTAKKLCRCIMNDLLEGKPLKSRDLFS